MIQQKGFIRLRGGSMGDTTFVKSADGSFRAQEKKVLPKARFKTDPAFQRVRENNSEFLTAAKAGKLLRYSVNDYARTANDSRTISRLLQAMRKVINADKVSGPGLRNVLDGDVHFLNNFEFNKNSTTQLVFPDQVVGTINRVTGELTISHASIIPTAKIVRPSTGATHFEIVTAGVELDLEQDTFKADNKTTGILPYNNTPLVINAVHTVTANSTHPLMLVFGVQFHELFNGVLRPFTEGTQNALKIVVIQKP